MPNKCPQIHDSLAPASRVKKNPVLSLSFAQFWTAGFYILK